MEAGYFTSSALRKRNNDKQSYEDLYEDVEQEQKPAKVKQINAFVLFASLSAVYLAVWLFVHVRLSKFPVPADPSTAKVSDFVEFRARKHLEKITGLGPRVAGSDSSRAAADYIIREIAKIKSAASKAHNMETDVQIVSGSFVMDLESIGIGTYPSVYENQPNVVVRIGPEHLNHSLLVNCHFDTVVDSPGTSDDAVSCVVMLEMLRALSKQDTPLPHNVIFLFNGAEENILQTSHGFITQHKWASSIRAFINLESAGAGGWELLFQTGPDHPWLIETYIAAAPYPYSSVVGQEIFQGGLVPSDTDFRIFRDYGHIPGLDLAHIRNGYVYHTRNDLPVFVEAGCIQRTGDNILALVRALVASPYLVDAGDNRHGTLVFFDVLGLFVVAYPQRLAVLLNWAVVAAVIGWAVRTALTNRHKLSTWARYQLAAVGGVLLTWVVLVGVAVAMALVMMGLGRSMSYFTHDYNTMWIFISPAVCSTLALHHWLGKTVFKEWRPVEVAELYLEANVLLWSLVVGALTYCGIMSAYIPLMFVLGPLSARCLFTLLRLPRHNPVYYCLQTVLGALLPQMYVTYMGFTLLTFFIPIMGRVGTEERPDVVVSVLTMLPIAMVVPLQVGLVYLSVGMDRVVRVVLGVTLLGVLAIIFTPLGFPFTSADGPSKQRIIFNHADRQFHGVGGAVLKRESSLWVKPLDHVGVTLLERENPELFRDAKPVHCEGPYCGRPYLYPILSRLDVRKTVDLPAPLLTVPRVEAKLLNTSHGPDTRKFHFQMTGPDHVTIFISPVAGAHIVDWSLGQLEDVTVHTLPSSADEERDTHFVYYAYGRRPNTPWTFHVTFYTPPSLSQDSPVVDIAFAGHYLHGDQQYTRTMTEFVHKLPAWTTATGWSSTLDVYQF